MVLISPIPLIWGESKIKTYFYLKRLFVPSHTNSAKNRFHRKNHARSRNQKFNKKVW